MRQIVPRSPTADEKVALIVDVADVGFDPEAGGIGDLGIVAVTYQDGRIGEVIGSLSIQCTGSLYHSAFPSLLIPVINQAAIVIAHHARVIRPLCERLAEGFANKPWACTATEFHGRALNAGLLTSPIFSAGRVGLRLGHAPSIIVSAFSNS
jgi:DNA polymerase-3 subunit epsilon